MTHWQDKIAKLEALIARTSSEGEREAARLAKERLLEKQQQVPVEYRISHHNLWKKKLFLALCQKYELVAYRYKGQKHTTSMVKSPPALMENYLWPEYKRYSSLLENLVQDILDDLLNQMGGNLSETVIVEEANKVPPQLICDSIHVENS